LNSFALCEGITTQGGARGAQSSVRELKSAGQSVACLLACLLADGCCWQFHGRELCLQIVFFVINKNYLCLSELNGGLGLKWK